MKRLVLLLSLVVMVNCSTHLPVCAKKDNILEGISKLLPFMIGNHKIGQLFSEGLEKQYGLANDPEGQMRIQGVSQKLLSAIETEQEYDFAILDSNIFNACSIYGGHIRVFSGLLKDTQNSDNELAAILAHEIAHNELGHNREAVKNFKIAYALDLMKISEKTPKLLIAGANAVLAKKSREHERAADAQALEWLNEAGYPITGAIAVFRRIEAEHRLEQKRSGGSALSQRFNQIFSTHPEPITRAEMAEDYLFMKKYGRTFKDILGTFDNSLINDLPIIVAHPQLWDIPMAMTDRITGVGVFNSAISKIRWQKDIDFYLDILRQGQMICVTADNDFHAMPTAILSVDFTFIDTTELNKKGLINAIKACRTYASTMGIQIADANFEIGINYPKVQKISWQFSLCLPPQVAIAPKIKVFRNGQEVAELEKTNFFLERQPVYQFTDENLVPGKYWYVLYIPSQLITSPITCEVTNNPEDPIDFPSASFWHRGIIHCHSLYSDGKSSLVDLWISRGDSEFIFMTDHAEVFGVNGKNYTEYVEECEDISPLLIPGVEYSLSGGKNRHLLVLGLEDNLLDLNQSEKAFFNQQIPQKLLIFEGPVHLGDDEKGSEIEEDAVFEYGPTNATLKLKVKGSPYKDPIIWINRHEIGRIVTSDDKWHWYEFKIKKEWLNNGTNLFHIESFIPDRFQTFDDCEVRDVWILKN